ncbi:hypothetical protein CSPAE12_09847, partial [Colletotrichum incanum]
SHPLQRSNRGVPCCTPGRRSRSLGTLGWEESHGQCHFPSSFCNPPTLIPQGLCLSVKQAKAVRQPFTFTAEGMKRVL